MQIPDAELGSLKEYLKAQLEPICDAEPAVLADYVIALLKHDKSPADLKDLCLGELADFLRDQTAPFVDGLFAAVASKSYLRAGGARAKPAPPATHASSAEARRRGIDSDGEDDDDDRNFKHRRARPDSHMDMDDGRAAGNGAGNAIETYEGGHGQDRGAGPSGFQKRRRDDAWEDNRPGKMMRGPPRGGFGPMGGMPFDRRWGPGPGPMMGPGPGGFEMPYYRGPNERGFRGGRGGFRGGPGGPYTGPRRGRCYDYDEKGYCLRGEMCPYDHGEDRIVVEPGQSNAEGFGGPRVTVVERRSDAVDTSKVGAVDQEMQDATVEPISPPRMPMRGRGGFAGRGGHQGRAGFTAALAGQPRSNTILVVEKIPDEFCNLDKVNEFFKKFGTITNIQVDRYQHKATVQFSNQHEARQAYSSPDAVFGNRFVKVFYMALESARAQGPGNAGPMDAASEGPTKLAPEPAKPTLTPEEQKEREAKLKEILEQEEKLKKEALQAKILLAKRQAQEALARQAAEGTPKSIKELLEEKERARLDRDLDMLAAGGEQGDQGLKQMLESKVAELQAEANALGVVPSTAAVTAGRGGLYSRPPRGGRGSWRGRGRGAVTNTFASMRLDLRPRRLLITNYLPDDQPRLESHFQNFGTVESFAFSEDGKGAVVEFQTRREAEMAFAKGAKLPDTETTLSLTWYTEGPQKAEGQSGTSLVTQEDGNGMHIVSSDGGDVNVDLYDEEEPDEDRRWRR